MYLHSQSTILPGYHLPPDPFNLTMNLVYIPITKSFFVISSNLWAQISSLLVKCSLLTIQVHIPHIFNRLKFLFFSQQSATNCHNKLLSNFFFKPYSFVHEYFSSTIYFIKEWKKTDKVFTQFKQHMETIKLIQNKTLFIFFHHHFSYLLQTLTELDLQYNQIGAEGAQYLSEALKINKVSSKQHSFHLLLSISFTCISDTHYTRTQWQSGSRRCTIFEWSIENQYS